jgi:hypothetical protein
MILALFDDDDEEDGDDWALDTLQWWNEQVSSVPHVFIASSPFVGVCSVRTPPMTPKRWRTRPPMTWRLRKPSVEPSKPRSDHRKCSPIVDTHRPHACLLQAVPKALSYFLNPQNLKVVAEHLVLPAPARLIHNVVFIDHALLPVVLLSTIHLLLHLIAHPLVVLHLIALPCVPLPLVILLFLLVAHLLVNPPLVLLVLAVLVLAVLLLAVLLLAVLLLVVLLLVILLLVILLLVVLPLVVLLLIALLFVVLVGHCHLRPVGAMVANMYVIVILIVPALILACFLGLSSL